MLGALNGSRLAVAPVQALEAAARPSRQVPHRIWRSCPTGALRSDNDHEAAHTALLPHRAGSRWDGSHFTVLKSPRAPPIGVRVRSNTLLLADGRPPPVARSGLRGQYVVDELRTACQPVGVNASCGVLRSRHRPRWLSNVTSWTARDTTVAESSWTSTDVPSSRME